MTENRNQETSGKAEKKRGKGIPLQVIDIGLAVLAVIAAVALLLTALKTRDAYDTLRMDTETYVRSRQSADTLKTASDYMTQQVRLFAENGDPQHVANYFEEALQTRRRERALEDMNQFFGDSDAYRRLEKALEESHALMDLEYYAMRLKIEATGQPEENFPVELQQTVLSPQDEELSAQEKDLLAREKVFDEVYQSKKAQIDKNVSACAEALVESLRMREADSSEGLLRLLRMQYLLIALLVLFILAAIALTAFLVVMPLRRATVNIRENRELAENGAAELRYLARTYNQILEKTRLHQEQISYEASHDPLTGLYNRGVFEDALVQPRKDQTLILIDIDHFKELNDTYGHKTGDLALQKLAGLLQKSFRAEDYVCRIGGDEFAVIMVHTDETLRGLIAGKLTRIAAGAAKEDAEVPAFGLSMGVAFGALTGPGGDLYKDADAALYRVKENGRGAFGFYGDND